MILDYIQGIMLTVLEIICCKMFFESFGEKRSENSLKNNAVIFSLIICCYLAVLVFHNRFIFKQILVIVMFAMFMTAYIKIQFWKSIVLSLLFQGLLLSADYLTLWVNVSFFKSIADINKYHLIGASMITVISKIILFLIVILIRKKIGDKTSDVLSNTDLLRFMFFPIFTIFTIIALIITSGSIENQRQNNVLLAISLCLAGMNLFVFYLINDILKREIRVRESELFRMRAKNQTDMYRSVSENFVKQRKITHEYKNQILCIESLINTENYEELKNYIKNISGHLSTELDYIKTNNVIVDAILNSKYRETLEKGIIFIFQLNDLSEINLSDEDIVVILSNLLSNAIEACEKYPGKKVIKLKFIEEGGNIIISVKNTYNGKLEIRDGEIQTSKIYDNDEHGIGIKNIIDVIEKYQGSYTIQNDKEEFYFSIMLPNFKK
ncbi:MAG: sensor histidine kinase [Catonella sp.]|uniref:sensor histidine kinase n=1 Tax=Catonella sp. TaxID=2382125 RepID=UPI003F9F3151